MSNNLNLDQLTTGQASKEATINNATGQLDAALTETMALDFTSADITISAANYERHLQFTFTNTGTHHQLTLLAQKKLSLFSNNSGNLVTIVLGTTTLSLPDGQQMLAYTDGTANGLSSAAAVATSGAAINDQTGTTYTFVAADASVAMVRGNNASAQTYTVPPNSSVPFPIGTTIVIAQKGAGVITLAPGSGVTIQSAGAHLAFAAQYGQVAITKTGTNEWYATGALA